jgi:hypothetical protein
MIVKALNYGPTRAASPKFYNLPRIAVAKNIASTNYGNPTSASKFSISLKDTHAVTPQVEALSYGIC